MQYTIEIDGVSVSASQLNMVLTIDKTLDYGSFAVRNQVSEPFTVGDMVDIDITDGVDTKSYHFIVSADDVTQLPSGYFLHTINIIELTKILEWQTESVRTFTQKIEGDRLTLLDVLVRLQFTAPIEKTANLANTRIFAIDNAIRTRFAAVEVPDLQFNNKNLKEILIEVFDLVDAIPRLVKISDSITLTADFYNERNATISEDAFYRMERFDIKDYSTALDAEIKNLYDTYTDIVEPSDTGFKPLSSDEGYLTEDNAFLKTQYPIVEIESLKVKVDVTGAGVVNIPSFAGTLDITDYIVEKEAWDLLENKGLGLGIESGRSRDNTLFFNRFSTDIGKLFEPVGAISIAEFITNVTETRINNIIRSAVFDQEAFVVQNFQDFDELEFQIKYKAQIDSRTEVKRLKTTAIQYDSQTYVGQTDNVVRADRVLDRLFKLQQLLGNAEFMTSERVTAVDDIFNLSDRSTDDYVLTTIELDCNKNHITAKYMWSQSFQKVSEFIGLNNELRLYNIPSNSFKRNIYIEDFVEVSDTQGTNNALVSTLGILTFMNTFNNSPNSESNKPIRLFSYNSESVVEFDGYDNTTDTIIKPVTAYAGGNSMNFHVEFENSTIAGTQLVIDGDGNEPPLNRPIIYSNNQGEVFDFEFNLVNNATIDNAVDIPIVEKTDLIYKLVESGLHTIYKDTREQFALTYALHVIPEEDLENTIIIGKYLVERNNLLKIISTASNQFEVFGTNTPYTLADNRFSRSTDTVVAQTYTISGERVMLSGNVAFSTWGIRKIATKELVVAVNQGDANINSLYFNFRDKQTGVTYPSQTSQPSAIVKRPTQIALNPPSANPTSSTIQIVWVDGNTDPVADEFELGISSDLTNWVTSTQAPAGTNSKTFTGLAPFTRFVIRIRAEIGDDYSEWAYFEATTTAPAPDAPTNLTLTAFGDKGFTINWDADETAFLHRIEISESNTFSPLITGGLKTTFGLDTTFVINGAIEATDFNTQYFVRVRSLADGQFSSYSSTANITTIASPITSAPTITNVTVSGSDVTFTLVNTDNQLVTLFADFAAATTSRASNVRPNEAQTFTVSFTGSDSTIFAKATSTGKANSAVVSIQFVAEFAPSAPSISAITSQVGRNLIDWTYSGEIVTGFVLERNPNFVGGATFGVLSDTIPAASRTFIDSRNIDSLTTYSYQIRAYNRAGQATSATSDVTTIAMIPAAPTIQANQDVQTISATLASVIIVWSRNSTDETGFVIEYRETSTMAAFVLLDAAPASATTAYVIFDRVGSPTKSYLFRVRAVNEFGQSAPSGESLVII